MTLFIHRKEANHGTGAEPGLWVFEEFMFEDAILGMAKVRYTCRCRRLAPAERAEGDLGKPYQLEIVDPVVSEVHVYDDDGEEVPVPDEELVILQEAVLTAFRDREEDVLEFEMGLL